MKEQEQMWVWLNGWKYHNISNGFKSILKMTRPSALKRREKISHRNYVISSYDTVRLPTVCECVSFVSKENRQSQKKMTTTATTLEKEEKKKTKSENNKKSLKEEKKNDFILHDKISHLSHISVYWVRVEFSGQSVTESICWNVCTHYAKLVKLSFPPLPSPLPPPTTSNHHRIQHCIAHDMPVCISYCTHPQKIVYAC